MTTALEKQLEQLQQRGPSAEVRKRALKIAHDQWNIEEISGTKFLLQWAAIFFLLFGINFTCQHLSTHGQRKLPAPPHQTSNVITDTDLLAPLSRFAQSRLKQTSLLHTAWHVRQQESDVLIHHRDY